MNIVSFSEARTNLKLLCDRVVDDADHTVITRRDAPDVVVMSLESFNSLIMRCRSVGNEVNNEN